MQTTETPIRLLRESNISLDEHAIMLFYALTNIYIGVIAHNKPKIIRNYNDREGRITNVS